MWIRNIIRGHMRLVRTQYSAGFCLFYLDKTEMEWLYLSGLKCHYYRTWSSHFHTSILLLSQRETNSLFHLSLKNTNTVFQYVSNGYYSVFKLIRRTERNNATMSENEGIFYIWLLLFKSENKMNSKDVLFPRSNLYEHSKG